MLIIDRKGLVVIVDRALEILNMILNDRTVPKNIRTVIEDSRNALNKVDDSLEMKISSVVNSLDTIMEDPNMPLYTRTQIWNLVSMLEEFRRFKK